MRLLRLEDNGELSLVEYVGKHIPRYAILSHTWGADHEEVTFRDLMEVTGRSKAGYRKLTFCGKQAADDGLQFFWVDTCCIDKASSAELAEAINSMFRWYHDAAKCYVYLSDVSTGGPVGGSIGSDLSFCRTWESAFMYSRWFTRGWTLQELLAPKSVEFFSVEGERLGDKVSLVQEIHSITGIAIQALQGSRPLPQFSINERISWAKGRETKREEDAAYSLLGIFDICMPLIYGEGQKRAWARLKKEIEESLEYKSPMAFPQSPGGTSEFESTALYHPKSSSTDYFPPSRNLPQSFEATFPRFGGLLGEIRGKTEENGFAGGRYVPMGSVWDLIQSHPLVKQGLVDISDVIERLRVCAKSNGCDTMFEERDVWGAIEGCRRGTTDLLI